VFEQITRQKDWASDKPKHYLTSSQMELAEWPPAVAGVGTSASTNTGQGASRNWSFLCHTATRRGQSPRWNGMEYQLQQ
jgi:hypothetical protein